MIEPISISTLVGIFFVGLIILVGTNGYDDSGEDDE